MLLLCLAPKSLLAETTQIEMPAEFVPARTSSGTVQYIDEKRLENSFRKHATNLKEVVYNHSIRNFIIPDTNWLHDLVDTYEEFLRHNHIHPEQDTWDCENYSILLNSFASIRLWQAGYYDTRLALGWMRVQAKYPWAGIPDAIHALIFAVTSEGILVIEPQNGAYTLLEDYPNKETIEEVYLF